MTRARGLLLALLAVLVIVWMVSPVGLPGNAASDGRNATQLLPAPRQGRAPFELADVAERLQQRRAATVAADRPALRNPFEFAENAPVARGPAPSAQSPAPPDPALVAAASAPVATLIGVVERSVDGTRVRVGVVQLSGRLYYVSVGDRIGSRYEVTAVDAEAVEIKDTTDDSARRLVLK